MIRLLTALLLGFLPQVALADDWGALESPTAIAVMRHALAPGGGDPAIFELGDCSTQRNLDNRGRAQAQRIGAALRARGIAFEQVWSSQWCRCVDTAGLLGLGEVQEIPALNSFFQARSRAEAQTAEILAQLRAHHGGRLMLVTHQVNITALTDVFPGSGEIVVIELEDGAVRVTGRILIEP
jgi:phosphohistidine phosphatase SixA